MLSWLQEMGIRVSLSTLDRQLRDWGLRRRTKAIITDELAERVNFLFHHTLLSDSQIASKITNEDGLETSDMSKVPNLARNRDGSRHLLSLCSDAAS